MQPFDYRLNVEQPFNAALRGVQQGLAIDNALTQRETAQLQQQNVRAEMEAAQQARMAAQQRQQRLRQLMAPELGKPTVAGMRAIVAEFPELAAQYKDLIAGLSEDEKRAAKITAQPIFAAVTNGQTDIAKKLADDAVAAYEAQGMAPEAAGMKAIRMQLDGGQPGQVALSMGSFLAALDGPGFAESLGKLGAEQRAREKAPAELTEAQAKAQSAAVAAKFAESNAVKDLERKGWDITKIQEDIKIARLNSQIAAASVAATREGNALRRDELNLKVEEMRRARDTAVREKAAEVESARFNIDNMLNTIDRVKQSPGLNAVVGPIEGGPLYPQTFVGMQAGTVSADDRFNAIALIETLGSQAFLSQIPLIKGTGNLSNAEGDKLQAALQNFNRRQGEKQFNESLDEVTRLLLKARKNIAARHGVPETVPDTPAAAGAGASDIEALVNKYAPR